MNVQTITAAGLQFGAGFALATGINLKNSSIILAALIFALLAVTCALFRKAGRVKIHVRKMAFAACLAFGLVATLTGCGTDPQTKIAQANKVLITSVKDGAQQWAIYVNAGKATQKQIDTVKIAYTAWFDAETVLKGVLEKMAAKDPGTTLADSTRANQAALDAENALLDAFKTALNAVIQKL